MIQFKEYKHDTAITDDTELVDAVPPGYQIIDFTFYNKTANECIIDCGSSSGGEDIFEQQTIVAGITTIVINKTISMTVRKSLYLNDDGAGTWASASIVVLVHMKKVLI